VWIDDEQYPAPDAKIIATKSHYTWCCLVGDELAHAFRTTTT
jgi:hypothetical protein